MYTYKTFKELFEETLDEAFQSADTIIAQENEKISLFQLYCEEFTRKIYKYLKKYEVEGKLVFIKKLFDIKNNIVTEYQAMGCVIKLPTGGRIVFEPISHDPIAASGRIDATSNMGHNRAYFVLLQSKTNPQNYIWNTSTRPPNIKYNDIDEEIFFEILFGLIQ